MSSSAWLRLALSIATCSAATVRAQDRFDVENAALVTASQGSVLNVYGGRTLGRGVYALALNASYGRKPLSVESPDGEHLGDLVGSVGTLEVLGAIGVWHQLEIGLSLPFHRNSAGSDFGVAPPQAVQSATLQDSTFAFGDIRVVPRVGLLEHQGPSGVDIGLLASVWLPTGGDPAYAGEALRVEPRLAIDYQARSWLIALNAGYLIRESANVLGTDVDDQLRFGVGADVGLGKGFSLLGEVDAQLNVLADDFSSKDVSSEALLGVRYRAQSGFGAQLAGGPGITRGMNAPMYRVLATIGFGGSTLSPEPEVEDTPELDGDHDGIVDVADRCPNVPEDDDQFQDSDGCPDADNDADAIADAADRCPLQAEDKDEFQDSDGCPDPDNDADAIADARDKCPDVAGVPEADGCPAAPKPEPPASVVVTEQNIELRETVLFGNNNAQIQQESQPLVDAIAKVLTEHPEIELVLVEGHTDDRGKSAHNQRLSEARAKSVLDALIARGIAAGRLKSAGFGASRPIVANDSDDNRAKNRRVELRIERRRPDARHTTGHID